MFILIVLGSVAAALVRQVRQKVEPHYGGVGVRDGNGLCYGVDYDDGGLRIDVRTSAPCLKDVKTLATLNVDSAGQIDGDKENREYAINLTPLLYNLYLGNNVIPTYDTVIG